MVELLADPAEEPDDLLHPAAGDARRVEKLVEQLGHALGLDARKRDAPRDEIE